MAKAMRKLGGQDQGIWSGMRRYLLDTNVFDALAKGTIQRSDLPTDGQLCATSVQLAELERTKDADVKQRLSSLFKQIVMAVAMSISICFWSRGCRI
ncbi:MAG: hypothetical protein DMG65_12255 [Candidatus Angelobacter sp. Gp1-AA117]|nr:MAG: hypothetical protein DMG65_12255 [Candidatus Angelobacter sp. Gp1-AA117]